MRLFGRNRELGQDTATAVRTMSVALFVALAGCAGGDSADHPDSDTDGETDRPPRVIEPVGQRSPFGDFLAGRFAERRRDYSSAAAALGRALEENPDNLSLLRRAFYVSLEAGRMQDAVDLAWKLEQAGLNVSVAKLLLAADSMRGGNYPEALARLEAIDRSSDLAQISVPLTQAWVHAGAGQVDRALTALRELDKTGRLTVFRRLHEGFINEMSGHPAVAEAAYRRALGSDPSTAPVRVVRALGELLERQGAADQARRVYQSYDASETELMLSDEANRRIRQGEKPAPLVADAVDGLAESFFDIATVLPMDRAGEIVLIYVRLALYLKLDFPAAQILLGDVLDSFGRHLDAARVYQNVDRQSPYGWVARLRLANNLYDLGRVDAAIRILREMAEERTDRSDAPVRLGDILRYEERYREAVEFYDQAIERAGGAGRVSWIVLYSRGIALERIGDWGRAEADFLRALEIEPEQPFVLNYLGYSWVERGRNLAQARDMLERAVAQRSDDGYIVDSMGWALYKLGEFEGAVVHLERAVALQPQDPVINDHLGDAYWLVDRAKEARIQWRRVLELDPEDDLRRTVRDKLQRGLPPYRAGKAEG